MYRRWGRIATKDTSSGEYGSYIKKVKASDKQDNVFSAGQLRILQQDVGECEQVHILADQFMASSIHTGNDGFVIFFVVAIVTTSASRLLKSYYNIYHHVELLLYMTTHTDIFLLSLSYNIE